MKQVYQKYIDKGLVVFPITISQQKNKDKVWKKKLGMPSGWQKFTLEDSKKMIPAEKTNGLAMVTGKVSNIIVIDIDNKDHWKQFLVDNKKKEPKTVKARSGSGGIHMFFKYDDKYKDIKSNTCCFDKKYEIDCRTNGGCIIVSPTSYLDKNTKTKTSYKWIKSIATTELLDFPEWMADLIRNKNKNKTNTNTKQQIMEKVLTMVSEKEEITGLESQFSEEEEDFIEGMDGDTEEIDKKY